MITNGHEFFFEDSWAFMGIRVINMVDLWLDCLICSIFAL